MNWWIVPERQIEIEVDPVSRAEFARFAQETGIPIQLLSAAPTSPVTQVSPAEACAFAAWLGHRDGHDYRLPTLDEMLVLVDRERKGGLAGKVPVYPHGSGALADRRPLSEWLGCVQDHGNSRSVLRCLANLSWLRDANRNMRGALSEGRYSFVTFRLVRTIRPK